jgi:hypothetical protein
MTGRHVLTCRDAWDAYKAAAAVETIAWTLPATIKAIEQGTPLPHVFYIAAAGTELAWHQYLAVIRDDQARQLLLREQASHGR